MLAAKAPIVVLPKVPAGSAPRAPLGAPAEQKPTEQKPQAQGLPPLGAQAEQKPGASPAGMLSVDAANADLKLARAAINGAGHLEFVGAVTDITVAKEAEQKLRRSDQSEMNAARGARFLRLGVRYVFGGDFPIQREHDQ